MAQKEGAPAVVARRKLPMERVGTVVHYFCSVLLCVQIVVLFYMVVARYVIGTSATGTDQLCLLCMVWYSTLTIALGIIDGTHIRVELVEVIFRKRPKVIKALDMIWLVVIAVIGVLMIIYGYRLATFASMNVLPSLEISKAWLYIPLPLSGALLVAACIEKLVVKLRGV